MDERLKNCFKESLKNNSYFSFGNVLTLMSQNPEDILEEILSNPDHIKCFSEIPKNAGTNRKHRYLLALKAMKEIWTGKVTYIFQVLLKDGFIFNLLEEEFTHEELRSALKKNFPEIVARSKLFKKTAA